MPTSKGGKNTLSNRVLIHAHCHSHIHYGGKFDAWFNILSEYKTSLSTKKETFNWEPSKIDNIEDV